MFWTYFVSQLFFFFDFTILNVLKLFPCANIFPKMSLIKKKKVLGKQIWFLTREEEGLPTFRFLWQGGGAVGPYYILIDKGEGSMQTLIIGWYHMWRAPKAYI